MLHVALHKVAARALQESAHALPVVHAGCSEVASAVECAAPEVLGTVLDPTWTLVSPAIDVWAVGVVLFLLLAKRPLFGSKLDSTNPAQEACEAQEAAAAVPLDPWAARKAAVTEEQTEWVRLHHQHSMLIMGLRAGDCARVHAYSCVCQRGRTRTKWSSITEELSMCSCFLT